MKNMKKLVALFAAATMAMSLSVSAFAAPSLSDGKDVLTFAEGDFVAGQAQVTMMAYIVEGTGYTTDSEAIAYVDQEIIALDQDSAIPSVKVNPAKIKEGTTVVIKTSGSAGEVQTFLLEQAVTPTGKVVTFMNGADEPVTLTSVDGKVTLPRDTTWNGGTPVAGASFELYSWVDENGNEYKLSEVTEITGIEEEVTLYAKYNTGIIVGDVNGTDGVTAADSSLINFLSFYGANGLPTRLNQPIYAGSDIIIGDVNGTDGVTAADSSLINFLSFYGANGLPTRLNKTIYLINGETVEAVFAD